MNRVTPYRTHFPDLEKFKNLSLALGKVTNKNINERVTVTVQLNRLNKTLGIYFHDVGKLEVHDPENKCNVGDMVVVKKLDEMRKNIETHVVQEIFFKSGFVVDPLTGRRVENNEYLDEGEIDLKEIKEKFEEMAGSERNPYYWYEIGDEDKLWDPELLVNTTLGKNEVMEKLEKTIDLSTRGPVNRGTPRR